VDQRRLGVHHAHAAPAATAGGLDDHRVADGARLRMISFGSSGSAPSEPGTQGTPELDHGLLGRDLVAHHADRLGRRPDEDEAALLDAFGEVGVLAQEAVAGVDGLGVGDLGVPR
jgi:hypothetical protein